MNNKPITVFTPTYNRAYLLPQLYESLCRQTFPDFKWLVIDDGSTDDTRELVQKWADENRIDIQYHYKDNGGMHTGHNVAYRLIDTELSVCIDSDDYMPNNAIEIVIKKWFGTQDRYRYAGILGLDSYKDGVIVSNKAFPMDVISGKYSELKPRYGIVGDIKFIYRTDIIKKYPEYPSFESEKFTPLGYKYLLIDQDYEMLFLNEVLCVVEYMQDGSTKNIYRQYLKNPKGFAYSRIIRINYARSFNEAFRQSVHLIAEAIIGKSFFFSDNRKKVITILALPFGVIFYIYIRIRAK